MSWDVPRPREQHMLFLREISSVCAELGGPLSKELNRLIQEGNLRAVVEFGFDYERGYTKDDFCYARQIAALVEKQEFLDLGYDKESSAVDAFCSAERRCRETNERLGFPCSDKDVSAVLHYAMRKIADILGDCPSLDELDLFFGPGATTNVKGSRANFRRKLSARMACSEDMLPYVSEFLEELPLWTSRIGSESPNGEDLLSVPLDVSSGRLSFVPKNSKTFRSICVEPVLNSLFQKGLGTYLKRRLKSHGVDLYDQSRNQRLAGVGSRLGNLATIDLKSASDSVSIGLVFNLLPFPWAELLSKCRTGHVRHGRYLLEQEKFSSMGNAYTFELESLIFFGLVYGCISHLRHIGEIADSQDVDYGVYGDDLIVPTCSYSLVVRVLDYCGFVINPLKSFCHGPFRESCGADFFLGHDIRPFYLKHELSDQVLYSFHNWAVRRCELEIARVCLRWTKRKLRLWGPDGYGDGHLVGSYTLQVTRSIRRSGWDGGYFRTYALKPKRDLQPLWGDILLPAYSAYCRASAEGPFDPTVIRGSDGCTRMRVYTNRRGVFLR